MKQNSRNIVVPGIAAILAVGLPTVLIKLNVIDAYTAQIITLGGVNAILAISVNTITGITGQLSLGQAGFMAIGAYSCIFFTLDVGLPLPVSVILAGLFTMVAGLAIILFITLKHNFIQTANLAPHEINIHTIGRTLLSSDKYGYVLPFEAVSILLLACIIGGIMIARKR